MIGARAAKAADLEEEIEYPPGIQPALARLHRKAHRVSGLQDEFEAERRKLIHDLAKKGFSTHDVGDIVGLSKPRVAQILNGK